jgi:hypothetical protein
VRATSVGDEGQRPLRASAIESARMVRIAPGPDAPYPEPTTEAAIRIGRANGRRDTRAELALRRELHRRGLRFRVDETFAASGWLVLRVWEHERADAAVDRCSRVRAGPLDASYATSSSRIPSRYPSCERPTRRFCSRARVAASRCGRW